MFFLTMGSPLVFFIGDKTMFLQIIARGRLNSYLVQEANMTNTELFLDIKITRGKTKEDEEEKGLDQDLHCEMAYEGV